jgi:hypothetical protein
MKNIFSDSNIIKVEINNRNESRKSPSVWKLNGMFKIIHGQGQTQQWD